MSAELLRRAATAMREDAPALDDDVAWHPAVALAVAEWLDAYAGQCGFLRVEPNPYALTVARAYLGESA